MNEARHMTGAMWSIFWGPLQRQGISRLECLLLSLTAAPISITKGNLRSELLANTPRLRSHLLSYAPNLVVLVGQNALTAAGDPSRKINDWRGSVFVCDVSDSPLYGFKCIAVNEPETLRKDWSRFPLFNLDVGRIVRESVTPEHRPVERLFIPDCSADQAIERLTALMNYHAPVALDIEGGIGNVTCISFSTHPLLAFNVPLETYTDSELARVLPVLSRFLDSPVPKVLQNSLYDNFVLSWFLRTPIRNVLHDTMLSGWEIYPELPKGLGTQVSIWTDEPFYKAERKMDNRLVHYTYCCKDSACTLEIHEKHLAVLSRTPSALDHYKLNVELLRPLLYMQLRGIDYDKTSAALELTVVNNKLFSYQKAINDIASLKSGGRLTSINPRSPAQLKELLYRICHYPEQFVKKKVNDETIASESTNVDSLLELKKQYTGPDHEILDLILANRKHEELRKQLETTTDSDGRVRCAYNVVGTETGRLTCYKSPTGSGANLQTITKKLRHLYRSDPGHHFFQCDLSGADGWTVAAHCLRLGDPTMFDDYIYGLKPAKIIALMYRYGAEVNRWDREKLRQASEDVNEEGPDGWLYFACKRVQHGSNYGLGRNRMSDQILKDSFKLLGRAVVVAPSDCAALQKLYLDYRYTGVKLWQADIKRIVQTVGVLPCASGHSRRFFGRREDHETYMQALAHEPQANTTYATNLAIHKLYHDPENREGRRLIIEPLHQVHDALCGQFPIDKKDWAVKKIRSYFATPLQIAGMTITIPFAGGYGKSWGELENKI